VSRGLGPLGVSEEAGVGGPVPEPLRGALNESNVFRVNGGRGCWEFSQVDGPPDRGWTYTGLQEGHAQ